MSLALLLPGKQGFDGGGYSPAQMANLLVAPDIALAFAEGNLFKDALMTIPVAADGDEPLRMVDSYSGQIGVIEYCIFRTDGTFCWLEFPYSYSRLSFNIAVTGATVYSILAIIVEGYTNYARLHTIWDGIDEGGTNTTAIMALRQGTSTGIFGITNGGGYGAITLTNSQPLTLETFFSGTQGVLCIDGGADAANSKTVALASTIIDYLNGSAGGGSIGSGSKFFAAATALTVPDRVKSQLWARSLMPPS